MKLPGYLIVLRSQYLMMRFNLGALTRVIYDSTYSTNDTKGVKVLCVSL